MDISTNKKNDEFVYDEIIIGCGFAGLYWCYKTKPKNFIILEKSDRI
jgi:cation diffusion facilitator CzcD-associated flavoprotein CzcO